MGKKNSKKLGKAAHVKRHTAGTSNELSFSILDAAKNELEGDVGKDAPRHGFRFGAVSLFSLPLRKKKGFSTPAKERGLPLSTGEFVSVDALSATGSSGVPNVPGKADAASSAGAGMRNVVTSNAPTSGSASYALPRAAGRSGEEEIARRKTHRRYRRRGVIALSVVVGLGLIGTGGWYLYQNHQRHQSQVEQLDGALDIIRHVDETVVALDGIVERPLEASSLASADDVLKNIPAARSQLNDADRIARSVSVSLSESKDKEAANQAVSTIAARRALLDAGEDIVKQAQQTKDAMNRITTAWQSVVKGDALAREAATLIADTTDEHVNTSKQKTDDALAAFSTAQSALADVAHLYPAIDLNAPTTYVNKRLEALNASMASDEALLAKNKEEAAKQNDAYNKADAAAAALAASLPNDPAQPASDAFNQAIETLSETYSTARLQAGSADAFLRDYLGTSSK